MPAAGAPAANSAELQDYGGGTTAFDTLPLGVRIDRLTPSTPPTDPEGTFAVAGWLDNRSEDQLSDLEVRLGIGTVLRTREQLATADRSPPSASRDFTPEQRLDTVLAPGESIRFSYRIPVSELSASLTGVYPLRVLVQGSQDGPGSQPSSLATIGSVQTFLPWFAEEPAAATRVTWLWPLISAPAPEGSDGPDYQVLAGELRTPGRLSDLLGAAIGADPGTLTVALDPDLLEAVADMADGYVVDGVPGSGSTDALAWLTGLQRLAAEQQVLAVPYGDIDTVASVRAGLAANLTAASAYGTRVVTDVLGVTPASDLSWPVDGLLTSAALDVEVGRGIRHVVLSESAMPATVERVTPTAASEIPTLAGSVTAVTPDRRLADLVAAASTYPGGDRLAAQRVLAETAMITAESPSAARNVVIAPPRRWEVDRSMAESLLDATRSAPWASATSISSIVSGEDRSDRSDLRYPLAAKGEEVAASTMAIVGRAQVALAEFLTTLAPDDVPTVLGPLQREIWRAESSAWRSDPQGGRDQAEQLSRQIQLLYGSIRIASDGRYTLSGEESVLPVTVANDLPVETTVLVSVDAPATSGFSASDVGEVTVPGNRRLSLQVPVQLDKPGRFTVTAQVLTPAGVAISEPIDLSVRSTAYGRFVVTLTVGALALFMLLAGLRLVRMWSSRTRTREAADARETAEESPGSPDGPSDHGYHPGFLSDGTADPNHPDPNHPDPNHPDRQNHRWAEGAEPLARQVSPTSGEPGGSSAGHGADHR